MGKPIDKRVEDAVHKLAASLGKMSDDAFVQEAIIKLAIWAFAWGLDESLPDSEEIIAEQLTMMATVLREESRRRGVGRPSAA